MPNKLALNLNARKLPLHSFFGDNAFSTTLGQFTRVRDFYYRNFLHKNPVDYSPYKTILMCGISAVMHRFALH